MAVSFFKRAETEHLLRRMVSENNYSNSSTVRTLKQALGGQRHDQFHKELRLDTRLDKNSDPSKRCIAQDALDSFKS